MNIAIVGAGGAVGREILSILEGGALPVDNLRLLALPAVPVPSYCLKVKRLR